MRGMSLGNPWEQIIPTFFVGIFILCGILVSDINLMKVVSVLTATGLIFFSGVLAMETVRKK